MRVTGESEERQDKSISVYLSNDGMRSPAGGVINYRDCNEAGVIRRLRITVFTVGLTSRESLAMKRGREIRFNES
mgnify:CR=1 FL=1